MAKAKIHLGDMLPYVKGMADESIDMLMTDVPYGVDFRNDIFDDSKDTVEAHIPEWYAEWFRILKPSAYAMLYVGVKNINVWMTEGIRAGFDFRNILATRAFNRSACAPKGNFVFEFQPILVFSKGKGKKFNEVDFFRQSEEWFRDKRNTNPKEFTYAYSNWIPPEIAYGTEVFGSDVKFKKKGDVHPNAKNTKLVQFLIGIATNQGEVVLDPFLGSGTTGVAALKTGRDFIGCEMNEKWFRKSKERLLNCNPLFTEEVRED